MKNLVLSTTTVGLLAVLAAGCGGGDAGESVSTEQAPVVQAGDDAMLELVNDRVNSDFERLDIDCAIRSDSTRQILRHRDGRDKTPFTEDDDLFDSVAELDDVAMVGPWTLDQLRECAARFGYGSGWQPMLSVQEGGNSNVAVSASNDGSAAVFNRHIVFDPAGNYVTSQLLSFDGESWSAPVRMDQGLPEYQSSYGTQVNSIFSHHLVRLEDGRLVLGLHGRYSGTYQNAEGGLYTLFLRVQASDGWGEWQRVAPVGMMSEPSIARGVADRVWFAWSTSNNLYGGDVQVSYFDADTGEVGPVETVATAATKAAFGRVRLVAEPGGSLWVSYWAPDGMYARQRSASGSWGSPLPLGANAYHDTVWADGTLWVASSAVGGVRLQQLGEGGFVSEPSVFEGFSYETDQEIESVEYTAPAITARPEGGVVIAAARYHHYENLSDSSIDYDFSATVVRERTVDGAWSAETVAYDGASWNNAGGAIDSTGSSVWVAGADWSELFAARRTVKSE